MTNRERAMGVLNYGNYDRMPVVHFGFWRETLEKWRAEGHIDADIMDYYADGNEYDAAITKLLGFDFNWQPAITLNTSISPLFPVETVKVLDNGKKHVRGAEGVTVLVDERIGDTIHCEIDHLLKDRESWEEHYKPRLQYSKKRVSRSALEGYPARVSEIGMDGPRGIAVGSLFGYIRNWMGFEGVSLLYYEDEELYGEIIETLSDLVYETAKESMGILKSVGFTLDYAHFWEDICFKNGPLVKPAVFDSMVGPHYGRITDMLKTFGVGIVSLDCDGVIDMLVPTWVENGVNTMFPIEVGTWGADIAPWREKYGRELRGVGGMNKNVFALDKAAIDAEIERLKPLIALGGYIPCPDHRLPPGAKWDLVRYYADSMRELR